MPGCFLLFSQLQTDHSLTPRRNATPLLCYFQIQPPLLEVIAYGTELLRVRRWFWCLERDPADWEKGNASLLAQAAGNDPAFDNLINGMAATKRSRQRRLRAPATTLTEQAVLSSRMAFFLPFGSSDSSTMCAISPMSSTSRGRRPSGHRKRYAVFTFYGLSNSLFGPR